MPWRLEPGEPLASEIRRVAREQLSEAFEDLDAITAPDQSAKEIWSLRKRTKRLRAWWRLLGQGRTRRLARTERKRLSALARTLGGARDEEVCRALHRRAAEELGRPDPAFASEASALPALEGARAELEAARAAVEAIEARFLRRSALVAALARSYARSRECARACARNDESEAWHDWRKEAKTHWYLLRLVRSAWPEVLEPWSDEYGRLTEDLGQDHDLSLYLPWLDGQEPVESRAFREWGGTVRTDLRHRILRRGALLHAEGPRAARRRLGRLLRRAGFKARPN